jgi:ParB-like chromosome segregation protein Spo0J
MQKLIPLKSVVADENQPRKYFNAEKLRTLKDSISKFGIINAITVEDMGNGNYLLVDGERRYRAATELKLTEMPANIEKPQNATERKVRQFNIQEHHEAWTPVEKAVAIADLSEELGISILQTCKLLNLTSGDAVRYASFAELVDKQGWVESEMPLDWAAPMKSLQNHAKTLYKNVLEEDWTLSDAKKLEHRVIQAVKEGTLERRTDLNRLRDTFTANPKMVRKFLDDKKSTPTELFSESKARGAYHLRNVVYSARSITAHVANFLKHPDVKITDEQVRQMKAAKAALDSVIAFKED